jgi:hypothetical protein
MAPGFAEERSASQQDGVSAVLRCPNERFSMDPHLMPVALG